MKTTTLMMTLLTLASATAMASDRNYVPPKHAPNAQISAPASESAAAQTSVWHDRQVHFVRNGK